MSTSSTSFSTRLRQRSARYTTVGWSALAALSIGCSAPAATTPQALDETSDGLTLPAGPAGVPQTLGQLGFGAAALGAAGTPLYLTGHVAASIGDGQGAADFVMQRLATAYRLGGTGSLRPLSSERDGDGRLFTKLQQLVAGVPVLHRELVVQVEPDGAVGALLGELVPDLRIDPAAARLDGAVALDRALLQLVKSGRATIHEPPTPTVYVPSAESGEAAVATLGYRALVEYQGADGLALEELVVAAADGAVLGRYSQRFDALSRSVADYGKKCLGMAALPGTSLRTEGAAASGDTTADRIYDNVGATYWYYKNYHGRDSYDAAGAALKSSAHVTFPSGLSCSPDNAAWLSAPYYQMVYGDGDGKMFLDLSLALDVTAHELTHAVTSKTSALVYKDESGALNEAMSDIFGATTSAWVESGGSAAGSPATVTPTAETWKIGAKAAGPTLMGGALRFMNNPTADKQSKDNYAERFLPGSSDNGGVHSNSGIANLTYYLLSEGGRHPRNKTATVVPGIGLDKAQRIFYQTNTKLLTSSATFQVARFSSAQAATNLYGRCSREWQSVHMAWDAVGVPGKWSLCVEPPSSF